MTMGWCTPIMLTLLVTLMAVSADSDLTGTDEASMTIVMVSHSNDNNNIGRTKRQAKGLGKPMCEAKYANMTPTHTLCLKDAPGARLVRLSQRKKMEIVKIHNDYRANVDPPAANMMKLRWDGRLARTAEKWVKQCIFEHDLNRQEPDWKNVLVAQNLGIGHKTFKAFLERLYTEKYRANYIYGGGYLTGAGHFFQMVTHRSSHIGCAESRCPPKGRKRIRACNYAPGMDASKPPYTNGTWCSACPNHCDSSGKLCDCGGKLCFYGGKLNVTTCQCECQYGRKGEHCEELDCSQPDAFVSCKNGRYTAADCGRRGTIIADPNMCPHLCGLCAKPCGGLECKNGGVLNWDTCKCDCRKDGSLRGPTCETCIGNDLDFCERYSKDLCNDGTKSMPFSVPTWGCPYKCGVCKDPCEGVVCNNNGTANRAPGANCACKCQGFLKGPTCDACPAAEHPNCNPSIEPYCKYPGVWLRCPKTCKKCTSP